MPKKLSIFFLYVKSPHFKLLLLSGCVSLKNAGAQHSAMMSKPDADSASWVVKEFHEHTCNVSVSASTKKPAKEMQSESAVYSHFSVTQLEKQMLAPAIVSACIMNGCLKPKDAKIILQNYVKRDLPQPYVSSTLKIAKKIAASGTLTPTVSLSKLKGHAKLLQDCEHHCAVETTDYNGMKQVVQSAYIFSCLNCFTID